MERMEVGATDLEDKITRENLVRFPSSKDNQNDNEMIYRERGEVNDDEMKASDSDEDDNDEDADEAELKILEASLVQNPYDYFSHLAIIAKLQAMGDLERLRSVRENMSLKFPLSQDIWLSWLRDEINLVTTDEQRKAVTELCEKATKDYLSVDVWLEYLQFNLGSMDTEQNGVDDIRRLFERALTAVGLHVTKGAIIWEAFREFEAVLVTMIDSNNEMERKEQLSRVGNIFRRQLACPLLDMEKTLEEYENWRSSDGVSVTIDDVVVKSGYKRAIEQLNDCLPCEEKLVSAQGDSELLDAYMEYLTYEKHKGDPSRVIILYERAITDLSLETRVWLDYLTYLETNIKIDTILEEVYTRASRNVPWHSGVWQKWMRSMEKWSKPLLEVQALLESALGAGFSTPDDYRIIWITFIECLRRRIDHDKTVAEKEKSIEIIRNTFNRACEHLAKLFGLQGDPNCVILQYWARTEAIHANDMEKARSLWSDIMSQGHSENAASWLEYISLERCHGDSKHLRKLYQKSLSAVKDWPESIVNSWVDFERDEGTLEQLEYCETKTAEKMKKTLEEREKCQQQVAHVPATIGDVNKSNKRKPVEGRWKNIAGSPNKQPKLKTTFGSKIRQKPGNFYEENVSASVYNVSTSMPVVMRAQIAPPPGFIPTEEEKMETRHTHDLINDKITVFISNLDYTSTEDEVKQAFEMAGPITFVKLILDYKGRSKGFGYVQLSNPDAVEEALKLDRTLIKGRPMFVSRCNADKTTRGSGFKYRCALEKNKLFVKGLAVTTTKEDLETLFGSHGILKEIRLVTYRNGHSKGLAYVEYVDEISASKALLATDGMTLQDKILSVAISQPPERKKEESIYVKSLGGTSVSRTSFGGPKTLLSMIPRTVNKSATTKNAGTVIVPGDGVIQPLNNQDFRNMLLNKK